MKSLKNIIIILFCTATCFSCKKNVSSVKGNWQWKYSTSGGIVGTIITPSSDSIVSLMLESNLNYTFYLNNRISVQGSYKIISARNQDSIRFDKDIWVDKLYIEKEEIVYQSNDTLSFINPVIEAAPSSIFTKIK